MDKTASEQQRENAGATDKARVRTYKSLVSSESLERVNQIANAWRVEHRKRTVPWQYEGPGAIAAAGYADYTAAFKLARDEFRAAVETFMAEYSAARSEAVSDLGTMFNEADYPAADIVRNKFAFELACEPMPNAADFRNVGGISHEQAAKMEADLRASLKASTATAAQAAWDRIVEHVQHMRDKLRDYTGKREGSFRDSLVDNLRELVALMPSLNITNDPELSAMAQRIHDELCRDDADYLRLHQAARTSTAAAAEQIMRDIWEKRRASRNQQAA